MFLQMRELRLRNSGSCPRPWRYRLAEPGLRPKSLHLALDSFHTQTGVLKPGKQQKAALHLPQAMSATLSTHVDFPCNMWIPGLTLITVSGH